MSAETKGVRLHCAAVFKNVLFALVFHRNNYLYLIPHTILKGYSYLGEVKEQVKQAYAQKGNKGTRL